ncbi:MAG: TetR/AcrR family transcriptional regulator [Actinobacteria bacterium]|nr:TetR/AcrR family transcriptional regulator [Actinomycetota bacterium]
MNNSTRAQRRATSPDGSDTRLALLVATRDCVREHGAAGATSRLIVEKAGANLGAITYYFGSKDQLVDEALFGELRSRLDPVMVGLESQGPAPARLLNVQQLVVEFEKSADDVPIYLSALMHSAEAGATDNRGREVITKLRERLSVVIAQLKEEGVVATWVAPAAMASLLVAAANGIALQSRLDPEGPKLVELASQLASLLLAASAPGSSDQ